MSDRTPDQNTRGSQGAETAQDEPQDQQAVPAFAELGIDGRVLAALEGIGYEKPSPIQAATIPVLLEGRDVVGMAQTGTGKTAAFAVPALSRLAELADLNGPTAATQVLVLAPTRELALQVGEAFASYAAQLEDFTVLPVYGGSSYGPQLAGLRRGAQVVVGTPGRVIDHLKRGSLTLQDLQYLVLDEADEMLRMGFAEDVETILSQTPEEKQVALFSATMPPAIRKIAQKYLRSPEEISVKAKTSTATNIRQRYLQVMGAHKLEAMTRLLEVEEHDGIIVFVRTKAATEEVAEKLRARGHAAAAINGDIPQQAREKSVEQLRSGKIDILVATDVAARGLDVERISLVVNYDIPHDTESYVHRIGRTGRAGRSGDAILFMTPREKYLLRAIEKTTRQPVEQMAMPSVEDVNRTRVDQFAQSITDTIESQDLGAFRSMVEAYVEKHDVDPVEVAAALAVISQGGQPFFAEELPEPPKRKDRERAERSERGGRAPRAEEGKATYWMAVGHKHRALPGSIVGALTNEGGLKGSDIGAIEIKPSFTLIGLPDDLSRGDLERLGAIEINGQRLDIRQDRGPKGGGRSDRGGRRGGRSARPEHGGGHKKFTGGRKGGQRHGSR
ncbi:DEAD/DEAH box helicase [Kocuria palustris]|uniref:DEAD/DEAH box helicase n=1 Tax=Kocuria palustris TaxID=71999 RepID=UPI0021B3321D|nr:DEAD/DEAH box helicase [Kocuria palustris]